MRNRRLTRSGRRKRYSNREDVNPMNFISNLSDVMLILAVGIMLALVIHWNVQLDTGSAQETTDPGKDAVSFSENDLENLEDLPDEMEQIGNVYYDAATGKYYIVQNPDGE